MTHRLPTDSVVTLITRMSCKTEGTVPIEHLVELMMAGASSIGFINAEVTPSQSGKLNEWVLVQRYQSKAHSQAWLDSKDSQRILSAIRGLPTEQGVEMTHETSGKIDTLGSITMAIATEILSGQEHNYSMLECQLQAAQARFKGYMGVHILPPLSPSQRMWVTLVRFDTTEHMELWMNSSERRELLEKAKPFVKSTDIKRVAGSFPGWIPTDANGNSPPNWKAGLLVLLGLYPIVTFEIRYFLPMISSVPTAPKDLIANAVSVMLTTWITMPLFVKWFGGWLFLPKQAPLRDHANGLLIILALLLLETLAMWYVIPPA